MSVILAWFGLLLCRLLSGIGLDAPAVCFGGDTSTLGFSVIILAVVAVIVISQLADRLTPAVIMVVLALTFVAVGSAAIIQLAQ